MRQALDIQIQFARLLAAWTVLVSLLAGPLAPLLTAGTSMSGMACCRRGKTHSCCDRKSTTPGKSLTTSCAKNCCGFTQTSRSASDSMMPERVETRAGVQIQPLILAGTGRIAPAPQPDPRFQRPPPAVA